MDIIQDKNRKDEIKEKVLEEEIKKKLNLYLKHGVNYKLNQQQQ